MASAVNSDLDQEGLYYDDKTLQLIPRWTRAPSLDAIEVVCREELKISFSDPCKVSFYAEGAFNKLYLIETADATHLFRVTLPVYPQFKTFGEVATLQWLKANTSLPVPTVLAFQGTRTSDEGVGFEWMLMERMPGQPVWKLWRNMSMQQKAALVERLAEFQAQLHARSELRFSCIGTLQPWAMPGESAPTPGRVVSHEFFMGDHLRYDVPRGPFSSSREWMESQLQIFILSQTAARDGAEDEDDKEDAEEMLECAEKLLAILPKVFPEEAKEEQTVIWHDDLNMQNILVDEQGQITAIVDWECVSALPLWMATGYPGFLADEGIRDEEPQRDTYADASADEEPTDGLDVDNEGKNELYWIHLMEYEATKLKAVYDAKMDQLWPDRARILEGTAVQMQMDFYEALLQLIGGIWVKKVVEWAEKIEGGEVARWEDME